LLVDKAARKYRISVGAVLTLVSDNKESAWESYTLTVLNWTERQLSIHTGILIMFCYQCAAARAKLLMIKVKLSQSTVHGTQLLENVLN
jgi:hypothetical protein